jgi:translation initiation factor 4G
MSRGGSRRGNDRDGNYAQVGPDGWAVAGGSGAPRPPPKAGDLSNFGKINKTAAMTFGPSSVFAGKKDAKRESISRTNSNSNMFSMLSQNPEVPVEASASKSSRPPSRKPSIDLAQSAAPEAAPPQRKKLNLLPRSKPTTEEPGPAATPEESASEEDEPAVELMSEADALKKIDEDSKEFFGVRNLEEAEVYFTNLPAEHRFRLVNKLVSFALESKESDAQLVGDFFSRAVSQELCSPDSFEEGFALVAEYLEDIAIDAPKAYDFMVIMLKGAGMDEDEERRTRIASKSETPDKLLGLLS